MLLIIKGKEMDELNNIRVNEPIMNNEMKNLNGGNAVARPGGKNNKTNTGVLAVDDKTINPTAAASAPAEPPPGNGRDGVNSSNSSGGGGGSVVKFTAMPAVVAYAAPGNVGWPRNNATLLGDSGTNKVSTTSRMAMREPDAPNNDNGGTNHRILVQQRQQGSSSSNPNHNNFGGASCSGSLSSGDNNAIMTGSSFSLSSDGKENPSSALLDAGQLKHPPELLLSARSSAQVTCNSAAQVSKQLNFGSQSETSNITNSGASGEDEDNNKAPPTSSSNGSLRLCNRNSGGASSRSGSDNNGGGATSSSGNAAAVTASANNNNTTSGGSGEDSGGGSGSGSGSGSGGNRRSGGEASGEYYYAGYGSGPSIGGTTSSNHAASVGVARAQASGGTHQEAQQAVAAAGSGMGMNNSNMPSFAQFQGAPLAASAAAAAAGPRAQQRQQGQTGVAGVPVNDNHQVNGNNMAARHVVVATDEGGLPPPPHAFASHLRHHSRHYHNNHRSRRSDAPQAQAPGAEADVEGANHQHGAMPQAPAAASPAARRPAAARHCPGIPSAIGGPAAVARLPQQHQVQQQHRCTTHHSSSPQQQLPAISNHYELRLPPSDEEAVLQRVPRTHATVVAHDLPPPPTSSDAWSHTSGGGGSRSRKRSAAGAGPSNEKNAAGDAATTGAQPMVASVRLANGGTMDSVVLNDGSPSSSSSEASSQAGAMMMNEQQARAMHVSTDDPILRKKISLKYKQMLPSKKLLDAKTGNASPIKSVTTGKDDKSNTLKRKMSAMSSRANTSESDSYDEAKSEAEALGSGSDEGYAASSERQSGSGSDSISSGDDANKKDSMVALTGAAGQSKNNVVTMNASQSNSKRTETSSMSSSVLADFSSVMNDEGAKRDSAHLAALAAHSRKRSKSDPGKAKKPPSVHLNGSGNNVMKSGLSIMEKSLQQKVRSVSHHHHYHSRSTGRKMLEKSFLSANRDLSANEHGDAASMALGSTTSTASGIFARMQLQNMNGARVKSNIHPAMKQQKEAVPFREASVYSLGQDVMAQVVSFLEPPEIHSFLTTPLSKTWLVTYTAPQELWKILCTSKPFYAKLDDVSSDGSIDASTCSFPICNDLEMRHLFGRYRLLYTSFVRCMKYLNRLQDDALNGRSPSVYTDGDSNTNGDISPYNKNTSLKAYFAKARSLVRSNRRNGGSRSSSDAALSITSESGSHGSKKAGIGGAGRITANVTQQNPSSSRKLASSMLTDRLLRPTQTGDVDNVNLPWSCAIYSVVNWMVAFADVVGIQIMCLKCLPYLLEDESQRTTAQRAGLTDSVLRAMVLFPDSIELHTVAFHTLVLLARPLGGNEGMLFHTAMVNTRGIFNNGSSGNSADNNSKNGIVIMLDSMRRFAQDEILQAMSCWSLVNVALTPLQKSMLVKLGGLTVTSNAMLQHPYNAEVQFRALFALINLVIPTETRPDQTEEMREFEREIFQQLGEVGETSEKEMLDASVGQISNLVVVSMKNFCSSEAILNRACLVLHNLSLNEGYHSILLWTPNCYQMLEWCLGNYPHDHVLQQSAGGTIQRLNATLSSDEELRARFTLSIRAQQQHSLELARQEAVMLQEQQREQEQQAI